MTFDRRTRNEMRMLCDEIHEDDGVDPREFFKSGRDPRKNDYKAKQLCRQAAETLDQVLGGEIGDPRLANLRVASVQPAPDASRLLVTVAADAALQEYCYTEIEDRLHAAAGRLRTAVAEAINRRRAPTLAFVLLEPDRKEVDHGREAAR